MGSRFKIKHWLFLCFVAPQLAAAECSIDTTTIRGDFGEVRFSVDVADEPSERAQGLMFVESMPRFTGMLFIYERPQFASFWMRNTLIPLDMLFVDETGRILTLHENAIPLDETPIMGGDNISHVLEINGGLSSLLGIKVGDTLQHPSFGENAVDPCPKP